MSFKYYTFAAPGDSCKTVFGPATNVSCIFPIVHGNTTITGCALEFLPWIFPHGEVAICPTSLDENSLPSLHPGILTWGLCAPDCPVHLALPESEYERVPINSIAVPIN